MTTTTSTGPGPVGADRTQLAASLRTLRLSGMLDSLDNRLAQAADGQLGFLDFLQALCLDEINRRDSAALERRTRAAKFESDGRIENFDFTADPGMVSVINGTTVTDIPVGAYPYGVAVDPGTHAVYVATFGNNTVSVIKGTTMTSTITVGGSPFGVAVDPATHTVYVTNNDSGTVSVITGTAVTSTVPVGTYPHGVAVDPGTHIVYITNGGSGTVSVITGNTNPTSKDQCKDGGWLNYPQFKNQGQYVAYVNHNRGQ